MRNTQSGLRGDKPSRRLGRRLLDKPINQRAVDMAHETQMERSPPRNPALPGEFPEPVEGENHVDIPISAPVIVIVVGNREIATRRFVRNFTEGGIAVRIFHVKGRLVPQVHPRRRHNRHAALSQRFSERSPRVAQRAARREPPSRGPFAHQHRIPPEQARGELIPQRPDAHGIKP